MSFELLSGLGSGPALIFTLVFGSGLAVLAYLFARPRDENRAFWIGCSVLLACLAVGIVLGPYAVCVMGILAGAGTTVYCGRGMRRRTRVDIALILGVVALCYVGLPLESRPEGWILRSALTNRLVYDDKDLLESNDFLAGMVSGAPDLRERRVDYWEQLLTRDFAQLAQKPAGAPGLNAINYYRPVIASSYAMDTFFWAEAEPWKAYSRAGGQRSNLGWTSINPVGYHLLNVLVHALNSLLLFLVVRSVSRNHAVSLAAGVLFAAHPIHTETVTWIAGRTDGIATTFFLAAFWLYLRFRNLGSWRALVGGTLLFLVGIFAKEAIAPLGLVLAAYEVIRYVARRRGAGDLHLPPERPNVLERRMDRGRALAVRAAVAVGVFFVAGLALYFLVKTALMGARPPMPIQSDAWFDGARGILFPVWEIWFTFMRAAFWYLGKCLWPWPLEIYPNVPWAGAALGLGLMLGHAAILGGAAAILWRGRDGRVFALGVLGFYLCLAPLTCVFKFARLVRFSEDIDFPVSERFLYVPSLFVTMAVAWVIASWLPRRLGRGGRIACGALVVAAVGLSAVACQKRAVDWYSDYNLFRSGVRTSPTSVRMSNNFGFELMQDWDIKRARKQLMRCTQLQTRYYENRPPMPTAFQNLGHSYYMQGEFDQAVEFYRRSFQIDPKNAVAANNLGALMGIFGSITMRIELVLEGLRYYEEAVRNAPNYVFAQSSMRFMRNVHMNWQRYLQQNVRTPPVVWSFGNSFLFAARSISEGEDPKYLQAMQILDSGLRNLPSQEELDRIFAAFDPGRETPPEAPPEPEPQEDGEAGGAAGGKDPKRAKAAADGSDNPRNLRRVMAQLFAASFESGVRKYEDLLARHVRKHGAKAERNPALNFLLGEVYRVGWRRSGDADQKARAEEHLGIALASEPEHTGATRGLAELLRAAGRDRDAVQLAEATVSALLTPEAPWEESVPEPIPAPRTRPAFELSKEIAAAAMAELGPLPGPEAEARRGVWRDFLEGAVRRCLEAQERAAESTAGGEDPEAWNNLGYFHIMAYRDVFRDGRMLEQALRHLDRAMNLDPGRQGPAINKIHALQLLGRNAEAEGLRRTMQQRFPRDVRFQAHPGPGGQAPGPSPPGPEEPGASPFERGAPGGERG